MAVEYALKVLKGEKVQTPVSMKGLLLSRDDPAGVQAFAQQLKNWIGK
jgi:hypothetical protein